MRRLHALALAALLVLAGCLAGPSSGPERAPDPTADAAIDAPAPDGNTTGVPRPDLPVGRTWVYEASGAWNEDGPFGVVVAEATGDGYLFAGRAPEDLAETVIFSHFWQGPQDRDLNRRYDGDPTARPLFDFPLRDGKTWAWDVGNVTARATSVPTPSGTAQGFEMTLSDTEAFEARWTYAPEVGYVTRLEYGFLDTTVYDLTLQQTTTSAGWTWFETGPAASTCGDPTGDPPNHAATLDIPEGHDAVVVGAGGQGGGRSDVVPPPDGPGPWSYEHAEGENWDYEVLEGTPGTWTLAAAEDPQPEFPGYFCTFAQAVTWTGPNAP